MTNVISCYESLQETLKEFCALIEDFTLHFFVTFRVNQSISVKSSMISDHIINAFCKTHGFVAAGIPMQTVCEGCSVF